MKYYFIKYWPTEELLATIEADNLDEAKKQFGDIGFRSINIYDENDMKVRDYCKRFVESLKVSTRSSLQIPYETLAR